MKPNLKILDKLNYTYLVGVLGQIKGVKELLISGTSTKAPILYDNILTDAGYEWVESGNFYNFSSADNNLECIYYFSKPNLFFWTWCGVFYKTIPSTGIAQWVSGDAKYPEGKANQFKGLYRQMSGQSDEAGGIAVAEPDEEDNVDGLENGKDDVKKHADPVDALISQTREKMGKNGTLPSDDILDLYQHAKKIGSNKLMAFIKTIKPLGENSVKKSTLQEIIRHIVKEIVNEAEIDRDHGDELYQDVKQLSNCCSAPKRHGSDICSKCGDHAEFEPVDEQSGAGAAGGMSVTANVSPVTGPNAFKQKRTMEGDAPLTTNKPYRFIYVGGGSGNVYGVSNATSPEEAWKEFGKIAVRMAAGDASDAEYDKANVNKDNGYWNIDYPQSDEGVFTLIDIQSDNPLVQKEIKDLNLLKHADEYIAEKASWEQPIDEISANKPLSVYPSNFKSVGNYIRIKKSNVPGEYMVAWYTQGKFNDDKTYYTDDLTDAYSTFVAMKPNVDVENGKSKPIAEMTVTGAVAGYNVPGAFSKRGGSVAGVKGSEALGYTLTPAGKKEMNRSADKLLEGEEEQFKKADEAGRQSVLRQIKDLEKSLKNESDPEKKSELKSRIFNLRGHRYYKK